MRMNEMQEMLYGIVAETLYDPVLGRYPTYAIQARCRTAEGLEEVALVHDVSTQMQFASRLSELFSRYQLSPMHLHDAIQDMLP